MFRGNTGKWSRWGLGFQQGQGRREAAGGCAGACVRDRVGTVCQGMPYSVIPGC